MTLLFAVGATGLPGVGKGVFIELLRDCLSEQGVTTRYYSLSNELRAEARRRGLPVERMVLRDIGNGLREAHGAGVLSLYVHRQIERDTGAEPATPFVAVIDGIRNPEEVVVLREKLGKGFCMVAVTAPIETLIERIASRARPDEPTAFIKEEAAARKMILGESGKGEPSHGHNINQCIEMADVGLDNSQTLDYLHQQIQQLANDLLAKVI